MDQLARRPLLAGEQGLLLRLAGAQAKLPVVPVTGILTPLYPALRRSSDALSGFGVLRHRTTPRAGLVHLRLSSCIFKL